MQDIWVSLYSIHSRSTLFRKLHHRPTSDIATSATTPLKTTSCDELFKILLGILGYWTLSIWDLFEVGMPTRSLRLHLARGLVRHGYPWVPTDQAHGRPRQVGPAYQKTRRPVSGPNRPSWQPTQPPEDLLEDPETT
jgi:hypothetical protein